MPFSKFLKISKEHIEPTSAPIQIMADLRIRRSRIDPFDDQPRASESKNERLDRVALESHEKSVSNAIDAELQREAQAKRKEDRSGQAEVKLLLLGEPTAQFAAPLC